MRGSVLLVVASLGLATIGSMLLWAARKITWRRPTPFLEQLESVSAPGRSVGPASGISKLDPVVSPTDAPSEPSELTSTPVDSAVGDSPTVPER